jgi:hypothetical protein
MTIQNDRTTRAFAIMRLTWRILNGHRLTTTTRRRLHKPLALTRAAAVYRKRANAERTATRKADRLAVGRKRRGQHEIA